MVLVDRNNLDVPEFIDADFFRKALESKYGNVEISKVTFSMGSKPGENYCSMIYRAHVTFKGSQDRSISLVVKSLPKNMMTEYFQKTGVFDREADIYTDLLPKIMNIIQDDNIAPRFFYFTKNPIETMVFEDATPLGYTLADRVNGIDESHCALVFQRLAKYHAASMQLIITHPEVFGKYSKNIMMDDVQPDPDMEKVFSSNFIDLHKVVVTWPGFEEIAKKINEFTKGSAESFQKFCSSKDDEMKVLVHNDLWTNNILFKYEAGKPEDLYFIDFQMTFFSSPGIDITHFLYTSPQFHLLKEKRDFMIEEYYYKELKSTLEDIGYKPIPKLSDILKEIENREGYGFLMAIMKLYLICMDKDKCGENSVDNLADAEKGEKIRTTGMSSERYRNIMQYVLRRVDKLGILG